MNKERLKELILENQSEGLCSVGSCGEAGDPVKAIELCDLFKLIDDIPDTPPKGGWISVEDRLPADQEPVLICREPNITLLQKDREQHKILQAAYDYNEENKGWYDFQDESDIETGNFIVTHWMYLPNAPSKEEVGL